ncbi:hypothetical protein BX070DRAFT_250292 [Coemansia spiralis]|nr:hypothetical protein BX070DRAFT_250292 [Coemansia spiralis]
MPSNNNKYTCKECGYTIEGNMGHASSCSKKSYINTSEQLSMAFAAIIMIITIDNTEHEITVSGRTTDGPFSSTNDEFMAIAAAVLAILKHTSATIHTDSQAAMAAAQGQLGKTDPGLPGNNCTFLIPKAHGRHHPAAGKKYSTDLGNQHADREATRAHKHTKEWSTRAEANGAWSTCWLCVGSELAPRAAGTLRQHQAELDTEKKLIGYIRAVQWNALASAIKPISTEEPTTPTPAAKAFLHDSVQRSAHIFLDAAHIVRTALHRGAAVPLRVRQKEGSEPHTRLHAWANSHSASNYGAKEEMETACDAGCSAPHTSSGTHGHDVRAVAARNKGSHRERQLLEKPELQYDRRKERDKLQSQREEALTIKSAKRRPIMQHLRLEPRSRDSRTTAVPSIPKSWKGNILSLSQVVFPPLLRS